jgi:pimeloyl-ACP methyl ester carboxylesterase
MSTTVICLHASGSSGMQWSELRARIDPRHDIVAPDFHGHGGGPAWDEAANDIFADDAALVGQLIARAPGGVHLVGHSYGGAVAMRAALVHPTRVRSVTLYEPVIPRVLLDEGDPAGHELARVAGTMHRELEAGNAVSAAAHFVDYWSGHGAWHELSENQQSGVVRRARLFLAQFLAMAHGTPSLDECRALRAPILLLAGGAPRAPVRRVRDLLASVLPQARTESMPALGHMGPVTAPALVARRIAAFVEAQGLVLRTMRLRFVPYY